LVKAEQYIKASWLGRQDAEVGKHLAEIAEAKGDKNGALLDYELALATVPTYDLMGTHKDPGPVELDLMARAEALRKAGAKASLPDPHDALQKLRFLPLGPANGLTGTAEYKFIVAAPWTGWNRWGRRLCRAEKNG
jgi:hypothetical protein